MRLVRFLLRYYRRHVWWLVAALATVPLYGAASAALVALIDPLFSDVLLAGSPAPAAGSAVAGGVVSAERAAGLKALFDHTYLTLKTAAGIDDRSAVLFTPLLVLAVFLVRTGAGFAGEYAVLRVGLGITTAIRNDMNRRLLDQDARFFAVHASGDLVSRLTNDVGLMQNALSSRLFDVVQQSVTLLLLLGLLFSTDASLAFAVLVIAPVFVVVLGRFGRAARHANRQAQARMADVTRVLLEGLSGHPVVKAFSGEAHEQQRFADVSARHFRERLRSQRLNAASSAVVEVLAVGCATVFVVYAGYQVRAGALSVALLVQFIANVWLLYEPVKRLNSANMALQPIIAAGQRILAIMELPRAVAERPDARVLPPFCDRIVFDRVTVRYGERAVVDQVSFEVRRGEVVAIVGPSGAGKTTLTSLVPRLFDPDEGRVLIDGHDVRDVTLTSLRSQIGLVTQHTLLFDDTIRHNIAYASPETPLEAVERAARLAYADEFVRTRPDGYDTVVGENGHRLSGGERQRIAVARAILKDAPILILDEATSQLDSEAEMMVQRALQNLMQGRSVLIVAHHLATVHRADRIIVLDHGRIVDAGAHDDLLVRCSLYRKVFQHWVAVDRG